MIIAKVQNFQQQAKLENLIRRKKRIKKVFKFVLSSHLRRFFQGLTENGLRKRRLHRRGHLGDVRQRPGVVLHGQNQNRELKFLFYRKL
jgi:hypothetical protein